MCLTFITKRIKVPTDEIINAYKIFRIHEPKPNVYTNIHRVGMYIENQWYGASGGTSLDVIVSDQPKSWYKLREFLHLPTHETYPTGFHAYLHKNETQRRLNHYINSASDRDHLAKIFALVPVQLRYVQTYGVDDCWEVAVAKEMRILPSKTRTSAVSDHDGQGERS